MGTPINVVNGHVVYHMVPEPEEFNNGGPPPEYQSSILDDVKHFCNLLPEYRDFDADIIMDINLVLSTLIQMGIVDPSAPLVKDDKLPWAAWIPDEARLGMVKGYVCGKVRMIFDPPASSDLRAALQSQIDEWEWRAYFEADTELFI